MHTAYDRHGRGRSHPRLNEDGPTTQPRHTRHDTLFINEQAINPLQRGQSPHYQITWAASTAHNRHAANKWTRNTQSPCKCTYVTTEFSPDMNITAYTGTHKISHLQNGVATHESQHQQPLLLSPVEQSITPLGSRVGSRTTIGVCKVLKTALPQEVITSAFHETPRAISNGFDTRTNIRPSSRRKLHTHALWSVPNIMGLSRQNTTKTTNTDPTTPVHPMELHAPHDHRSVCIPSQSA